MITFFSFEIDTKDQQFQTDEEYRAFVDTFIENSVSENTHTVVEYMRSLLSPDNMLLSTNHVSDIPDPTTGRHLITSTKTFATSQKAGEFQAWYNSTGRAMITEMFSGFNWKLGDARVRLASPEEWQAILEAPGKSDQAKARIESYLLLNG